jgi:hypothetical protein
MSSFHIKLRTSRDLLQNYQTGTVIELARFAEYLRALSMSEKE